MENTNAQRGQSTVFLSYAREDGEFMRALKAGLEERGIGTKGDWLLTTGDDFAKRLRDLNLAAHVLVFIISPDSIRSEACRTELALAVEHKKQILPVSRRDHGDDNLLDSALRAPQWTFLREGDEFGRGLEGLVQAIRTDFGLMDTHSRLLVAADNWDGNRRNRSYLLRKDGLKSAEAWLAVVSAQPDKLPQPTALEIEFIFASRRARNIEAKIAMGIAMTVAVALAVLAVVAFIQRNHAVAAGVAQRQQREEADRQTNVARARLASISWNNGIKAREQSQPLLAAHHFMRAAEVFAQVADPVSSNHAQLAAEFLAGDYELEDVVEMKGMARGAEFAPRETDVAVWNYDEIDNFAGTTSLGIWDRSRHAFRAPVTSLSEKILGCQMNTEGLLLGWSRVGSHGSAIHLWDGVGREVFEPLRLTSDDLVFKGAEFSHDRKRFVCWAGYPFSGTGPGEGFARVYDTRTGAPLTPPLAHTRPLNGAAFSRDDSRVLTWGDDGFAKVWSSLDGSLLTTLNMGGEVAGALFSPDESRVVTWGGGKGDADGVARLWDSRTGAALSPPLQHDLFVGGARFNADGSCLVTWSRYHFIVSDGGSARVWDGKTGAPLTPHLTHGRNLLGAEFSADGKNVMTWAGDRTVRVWVITNKEEPAFPKPLPHTADLLEVHYTPDGASIVSITADGAIHFWDAGTGILISEAILNQQPIRGQTHTAGLESIVTWGSDGTARIWRQRDGQRFIATMRHPGMRGQKLSPDGARLLTWDLHGVIRIWNTSTGQEVPIRAQPEFPERETISDVVFSPDQRHVLILVRSDANAGQGGSSFILDASTGERTGSALLHESSVESAIFSSDGSRILTVSKSGSMEPAEEFYFARVWDSATSLPTTPPIKHEREILQADFTSGSAAVLTFDGETVRAWDAATGNALPLPADLSWHGSHNDRAFYGHRLAASGEDAISLKDSSTGQVIHSQPAKAGSRSFFCGNGSRLLVVFETPGQDEQSAAEIWESETGKVICRLQGEKLGFDGATFSADAKKLITWGSLDRASHVWDGDTGRELFPALRDSKKIVEAMLIDDEKRIVTKTESPDGFMRVWDSGTGQPLSAELESEVMRTQLAADGTRILAHSFYRAELRDARSGQLILPTLRLRWPNANVYAEQGGGIVSDDGSRLVDWNGSGRIRVWNLWTDYGWSRDRLRLRLEAQTGTRLNSVDEIELLSREEWQKVKADDEALRQKPAVK